MVGRQAVQERCLIKGKRRGAVAEKRHQGRAHDVRTETKVIWKLNSSAGVLDLGLDCCIGCGMVVVASALLVDPPPVDDAREGDHQGSAATALWLDVDA